MDFSEFFGCEWMDLAGGRFRWGVFERGDLPLVILRLISERSMHGYEVMRTLEEEARGCYRASPGSVYPTLQMLEDEGFLTSERVEGKKIYTITDAGRAHLDEHEEKVETIYARIKESADRFFGEDMKDLAQSFAKLAEETFEGAFKWTEDSSFMQSVKDILDQAAEKIDEAQSATRAAADAAGERAREAAQDAKRAAREAADEARKAARRAREAAREARRAAREAPRGSGATAPEGQQDTHNETESETPGA